MSQSSKPKNRRPNALKHGAFSSVAFFSWENRADFDIIHNELIEEWDPDGAFEQEAVFTIASCMWKKRRIRERRQLEVLAELHQPHPQSSREPTPFFDSKIEQIKFTLSNRSRSTAVAPPSARFNHDEAVLLQLSASLHGEVTEQSLRWTLDLHPNQFTRHLKEAVPRGNYPGFIDYIRALKKEIDEVLLPRVRAERPSDEYIAARTAAEFLTSERIMEDLALEERLDAIMDKAIRRLAQAKALKQMSGLGRRHRDASAVRRIDANKD
jgi:hypothetical protein